MTTAIEAMTTAALIRCKRDMERNLAMGPDPDLERSLVLTNDELHKRRHAPKLNAADHLQAIYLEWVNDWLTIQAFAEHYGINEGVAHRMIDEGRKVHDRRTTKP